LYVKLCKLRYSKPSKNKKRVPLLKNTIKKNIANIKKTLANGVTLLVASKYATNEQIQAVIDSGISCLGENKIQDAEKKIAHFGLETVNWHFIGHLQSNKANKAVQLFHTIQSIDSVKLLKKIDQSAENSNKIQNVFIQINVANDPNKFGFSIDEYTQHLDELKSFKNVLIKGIMCIVPYTENEDELRQYFKTGNYLFEEAQKNNALCTELSMGMSNDYLIAVQEGSTLVRLGSSIFKD
jgi:PLP dependent protein